MGTYAYPRAVKRIADDLLGLRDELLNKMGGVEEGVFRYLCKGTLLDEVDTSIGIVVVFGLLNESFDVSAFKVENTKWNTYVIRHCCYRHLCIVLLEM